MKKRSRSGGPRCDKVGEPWPGQLDLRELLEKRTKVTGGKKKKKR